MAGNHCSQCGIATLTGSNYCHACGTPIDGMTTQQDFFAGQPASSPLVEPDNLGPSRILKVLLATAAVALLGVVSLATRGDGGDSDPSRLSEPEGAAKADQDVEQPAGVSTPSGEPSQLPDGELTRLGPLPWTAGVELGSGWPLGFAAWDGSTYLFARASLDALNDGLMAWRSDDLETWQELGAVIPAPNGVTAVTSGPSGLVAIGLSTEARATVWRSDDAINWTPVSIPAGPSADGSESVPIIVVETDDLLVVAVKPTRSEVPDIGQLIAAKMNIDAEVLGGYGFQGDIVVASGPFRIPLATQAVSELGLTDAQLAQLGATGADQTTDLWSSTDDGATWTATEIGASIASLNVAADGSVLAIGDRAGAAHTTASRDGETWEPQPSAAIRTAAAWSDGSELALIRNGAGNLALRAAGEPWTPMRTSSLLPSAFEWRLHHLAVADNALAVAAAGYSRFEQPENATATLLLGGYSLTTSLGASLVLRRGDVELLTARPWNNGDEASVVNLPEQSVSFVDPSTAATYVTVTFEELAALERQLYSEPVQPGERILSSSDLRSWNISHPDVFAFVGASVLGVHVDKEHVLALVADTSDDVPTMWVHTAPLAR